MEYEKFDKEKLVKSFVNLQVPLNEVKSNEVKSAPK